MSYEGQGQKLHVLWPENKLKKNLHSSTFIKVYKLSIINIIAVFFLWWWPLENSYWEKAHTDWKTSRIQKEMRTSPGISQHDTWSSQLVFYLIKVSYSIFVTITVTQNIAVQLLYSDNNCHYT